MSSQPIFFSEFHPRKQEEFHCQPGFYGYTASKNNLKILILENSSFSFSFERTQFTNVVSARAIFNRRAGVKIPFCWSQVSSALNPPRTTERLVVYCTC